MRVRFALFVVAVVLVGGFAAPAADDPAALLKPLALPAKTDKVRLRVPVTAGFPETLQFKAKVPSGAKKGETVAATVALDTVGSRSHVAAKKLKSWGYDAPAGQPFVLPELIVSGTQVAPKAPKGRDATLKLTNVPVNVIEDPAGGESEVYGCDLSLAVGTLAVALDRAADLRLAFADKFLELTAPAKAVTRADADELTAPEVTAEKDAKLVPVAIPTDGGIDFEYAAVNGLRAYKTPDGRAVPVRAYVSTVNNFETSIILTIGLARGCKVEMDQGAKAQMSVTTDTKTELIPGKVKELRLGAYTGAGLKAQKDVVLKDVPVLVNKNASDSSIEIGPKFITAHLKDAVYAADGGTWKLHGRVKPDLLADVKTRKKQ